LLCAGTEQPAHVADPVTAEHAVAEVRILGETLRVRVAPDTLRVRRAHQEGSAAATVVVSGHARGLGALFWKKLVEEWRAAVLRHTPAAAKRMIVNETQIRGSFTGGYFEASPAAVAR
jgi:hypothetical protein